MAPKAKKTSKPKPPVKKSAIKASKAKVASVPPDAPRRKALVPRPWTGKAADPVHIKLARLIHSKAPDWSQSDIAWVAGMKRQAIHRILNGGANNLKHDTLKAILVAIGASLSEFDRA